MTREEVIERLKLILETDIMTLNGLNTPHEPLEKEIEALKTAIKTLEVMNKACNSDDLVLIHTQGLDEGIRCAMCTNAMKSDRGCDGSCVVNKDMYKAVLDVIEKRIKPTTKNNLPHCQHTDEEIAKSFIEDIEAVKDQLPCGEQMDFPKTFDEFVKDYGFRDKQEVYTNGSELIPVFRVKQWLEHISTTKNDLGVDCISRVEVIDYLCKHCPDDGECFKDCDEIKHLRQIPSVTPIRAKGHWISHGEHCKNLGVIPSGLGAYEWCSNCDCGIDVKEWHRSRYNYCPNCGADMREVEE